MSRFNSQNPQNENGRQDSQSSQESKENSSRKIINGNLGSEDFAHPQKLLLDKLRFSLEDYERFCKGLNSELVSMVFVMQAIPYSNLDNPSDQDGFYGCGNSQGFKAIRNQCQSDEEAISAAFMMAANVFKAMELMFESMQDYIINKGIEAQELSRVELAAEGKDISENVELTGKGKELFAKTVALSMLYLQEYESHFGEREDEVKNGILPKDLPVIPERIKDNPFMAQMLQDMLNSLKEQSTLFGRSQVLNKLPGALQFFGFDSPNEALEQFEEENPDLPNSHLQLTQKFAYFLQKRKLMSVVEKGQRPDDSPEFTL